MAVEQGLLIGELSRRVGIPSQTIRYYERLGLIEPPRRTPAHYRLYSEAAVERLQFIQKAKRFGLSLEEIKTLIEIRTEGVPPCTHLKVMLRQHLDELEQQIQEMIAFRQELVRRYTRLDALLPETAATPTQEICNGKICGFIEQECNATENGTGG